MNPVLKFLFGRPNNTVNLAQSATHPECTNCGAALSGPYCSQCGQKKEDKNDFSISHFLGETVHAFTHFDSKFFATIKYLVFKPGKLTQEFILGHRKKFMHPLQLFLVVNIIYFLMLSSIPYLPVTFSTPLKYQMDNGWINHSFGAKVNQKIKDLGITYKEYETEFNHRTEEQAKTLIIVMVPVFALLLALFFAGQKRYFIEHLTFSFHFFSFILFFDSFGVLLIFGFYKIVSKISLLFGPIIHHSVNQFINTLLTENNSSIMISILYLIYLMIGFQRVYSTSNVGGFFRAFVGVYCFWMIVFSYRALLFYTTFYGLRLSIH